MKNKLITFSTATILTLYFLPQFLQAQTLFTTTIDSLIKTGIDQTFRMHCDSALCTYDQVCKIMPEHPAGFFHKAAALQSYMMDFETDLQKEVFFSYLDTAEAKAEKLLLDDQNNSWAHFYLGSSLSYRGLYQAKTGKIVSGFISAKKGLHNLSIAVELDSTLYDALLGLGNYSYWAGKYYKHLKWLPWIQDKRDEGIDGLKLAIQKGRFARWVGLNSLGWIEWDRTEWDSAIDLFSQGLKKYPGSRFFLWGLADTYFSSQAWDKAIPCYLQILISVRDEKINNRFNEVTCLLKLAECFFKTGQYHQSFKNADNILKLNLDKKIKKRLKKKLKQAETIRHESLFKLGRIEVKES